MPTSALMKKLSMAFFPVTALDVKSVPEPHGAIALGIVGALMLMAKRKTSTSQNS